jgi:hypothetical protein
MLVGAGVRAGGNPGRFLYGAGTGAHAVERSNYNKGGTIRNFHSGSATGALSKTAGIPNGYEHPAAWSLPRKGGGLASRNLITGAGEITAANLAMGRALSASLLGEGDVSAANLSLIVSLLGDLSGSGTVTGSLRGAVQLAAALAGAGDITAAMGALVFMSAGLTGSGTLDGSALRGTASLAAEILSYGDLTPEGIRDAVWNAVKASFVAPGSMGEVMNGSFGGGASAADIWAYASRTLTSNSSGITTTPLAYKASTTITEGDPGTGRMRWNNANQLLASFLFIDHITDDGLDISNYILALSAGSQLYIQDRDNAGNWQRWIIGSIEDDVGWFKLGVSLEDSAGVAFSNNHQLVLAFQSSAVVVGLTPTQSAQLLEIFQRLGLDPTKPLLQTATEISTADWTLAVTEGTGTVTVERQP